MCLPVLMRHGRDSRIHGQNQSLVLFHSLSHSDIFNSLTHSEFSVKFNSIVQTSACSDPELLLERKLDKLGIPVGGKTIL